MMQAASKIAYSISFVSTTFLYLLLLNSILKPCDALSEEERVAEYHKRNYTWPMPNESYVPNTAGWRELMQGRFAQVSTLEKRSDRYEGYIQLFRTAFMVPNLTQHGFGLTRCLDDNLMKELRDAIHEGLPSADFEIRDSCIPGPLGPLLIHRPDLTTRVLHELHSYAEEWAGMELVPHTAYGFRLYQNESQLYMHTDKTETHVISFILHIDSVSDKPWPLYIEDFHGNTHSVSLTSGDILFYESAKLFHGRPEVFHGSWYSSLFVHYYPKDWSQRFNPLEAHYAVPPQWSEYLPSPESQQLPKLEMHDVALTEPECPSQWCKTRDAIRWGGPAKKGILTHPTGEEIPFRPKEKTNDEL